MPSSLVLSWWFHGYLKWRLAHSSRSLHPSSGVIIQPYIHLHELSPLLPSFSFVIHVWSLCSCVLVRLFSFSSSCSSSSLFLVWCLLISSTSIQFSCLLFHFVRFIVVPIQFYSVLLLFLSFCLVQFDNMWNFHMNLDLVLVLVSSWLRTLIQF